MSSGNSGKLWGHAIETGILAEALTYACAAALPLAHVPGWVFPVLAGVGGIVGAMSWMGSSSYGPFAIYLASCGLLLSGWSVYARLASPWTFPAFVALTLSVMVMTPLGVILLNRSRGITQESEDRAAEEQRAQELQEWDALFASVDLAGVKATEVKEGRAGREVRVTLPRSGKITRARLEAALPNIEVVLRTRPGTTRIEMGEHSADWILHLTERDVLKAKIPLLREHRPTTINKPFAVGVYEDGTIAKVLWRQLHALIVGVTGSGKSNLVNVLTAQMARMPDTLIWMIDMKGGRTARPWLAPWVAGKTGRPALDWVATTRDEAELMLRAIIGLVGEKGYRSNSGIGGSKITPSASIPQIILICDEIAIIFGTTQGKAGIEAGQASNAMLAALGMQIAQLGRSEAVSAAFCTQRGTVTMIGGGDLKSQCTLRFALGAATQADARAIVPDDSSATKRIIRLLEIPGTGLITRGPKTSPPVKFFYADHPEDAEGNSLCENGCIASCPIPPLAIEAGHVRPLLDAGSAGALGEVYAERWERAKHLVGAGAPAVAAAALSPVLGGGGTGDDEFDEIISHGWEDPERKLHPARIKMREYLGARGVRGATPGAIKKHLDDLGPEFEVARETIQRWLSADEKDGLVHRATGPDAWGRWKIGPPGKAAAA